MKDLLKNNQTQEPPQVKALKNFAFDKYKIKINVRLSAKNYIIEVPSSSLAQKFREETAEITEKCNLDKPLVIHIGY